MTEIVLSLAEQVDMCRASIFEPRLSVDAYFHKLPIVVFAGKMLLSQLRKCKRFFALLGKRKITMYRSIARRELNPKTGEQLLSTMVDNGKLYQKQSKI